MKEERLTERYPVSAQSIWYAVRGQTWKIADEIEPPSDRLEVLTGEKSPNSKLTDEDVSRIRDAHKSGKSRLEIGNLYGVTRHHVGLIINGL